MIGQSTHAITIGWRSEYIKKKKERRAEEGKNLFSLSLEINNDIASTFFFSLSLFLSSAREREM